MHMFDETDPFEKTSYILNLSLITYYHLKEKIKHIA